MKHLVLLLCLLAGTASAQGYSASDWTITRQSVVLRVSLPAPAVALIGAPGDVPRYVLAHVDVHAGDAPCPAIDQGEGIGRIDTLAPSPGLARFELMFVCPGGGVLQLDDHILFERDPGHLDVGNLQAADHPRATTLLFDVAHQRVRVPVDGVPPGVAWARFIRLGARPVLASLLRIAILVMLLASSRRGSDWIAGLGAVLLGGIAAAILALTGIAAPTPAAAEMTLQILALLLALRAAAARHPRAALSTVALVVATLIAIAAARRHAGMLRLLAGEALLAPAILLHMPQPRGVELLLPAALFGVVLDAAFGDALRQLGVPPEHSALPVLGHATGAIAAIALIAGLAAAGRWAIRRIRAAPAFARAPILAYSCIAGYATFRLVGTL